MGPTDYLYLKRNKVADQRGGRANLASKLGAPMVTNLKLLSHERNAAQFEHLRSGFKIPKFYLYKPWDYVFLLHEEDNRT
jgi:hypothetical protein